MQYSQEHLKTMVYAKFGGQTECSMGNWKIENWDKVLSLVSFKLQISILGIYLLLLTKDLKLLWFCFFFTGSITHIVIVTLLAVLVVSVLFVLALCCRRRCKASKRNLNWSFTPLYSQLMDLSSDQSVERFLHSWPWVKHQHTICRPSGYQDLKRPLARKPRYKRINLLCVHKDSSKKDKSKWLFYKTDLTCI